MKKQKITQQYEHEKITENIAELKLQVQSYHNEVVSLKCEISNLKNQLVIANAQKSTSSNAEIAPIQPVNLPWLFSSIKGYIIEQKTITATAAVNEQWRYYQYLLNHLCEERTEVLTYEKNMMVRNAAGEGDVKGTQREWDKAVKVLNKAIVLEGLSPANIHKNKANQLTVQKRLITIVSDSLRAKINQVYFCKACYESLGTPINCLHVIAQGCVSHFKNTNNKVIKKIHNDHGLTINIIIEPDFDYRSWVYQLNLPSLIEFSCYCNIDKGEWTIYPIERNSDYADFDVRSRWIEAPHKNQSYNVEPRGEKRSRGRPPSLTPKQHNTKSAVSSSSSFRSAQMEVDSSSSDEDIDGPVAYASTSSPNIMWTSLGAVAAMATGNMQGGHNKIINTGENGDGMAAALER